MHKSRYSDDYERLLKTLREVRLESGLTQTQVAKHFNTHASFVSKCEAGDRRIDAVELAMFCKLYEVPLVNFLRRAGLLSQK